MNPRYVEPGACLYRLVDHANFLVRYVDQNGVGGTGPLGGGGSDFLPWPLTGWRHSDGAPIAPGLSPPSPAVGVGVGGTGIATGIAMRMQAEGAQQARDQQQAARAASCGALAQQMQVRGQQYHGIEAFAAMPDSPPTGHVVVREWKNPAEGHEGTCRGMVTLRRMLDEKHGSVQTYIRARNHLSDEAGALRTERDELLIENATLRRKLERAERKAKR